MHGQQNIKKSKLYLLKSRQGPVMFGTRCIIVYVVTRLPSGRSGVGIPTWATDPCPRTNVRTGSGAHPASGSVGTEVYFSD